MAVRTIRCGAKGCMVKTTVEMTPTQIEALGDAITCGARGDGWDLYRELQQETGARCHIHEEEPKK